MKQLSEYHFIAQAELTIDGVDDKEEFKLITLSLNINNLSVLKFTEILIHWRLTDEAFNVLNFNAQEKAECYRVISAIVHMVR